MLNTLQAAIEFFADQDRCFSYVVSQRWPEGVICPSCDGSNIGTIATRQLFQCRAKGCERQFSVKVGTIFEKSPLPLKSWMVAVWMVTNCKNGVSSHEIARTLGITQKSAWFMLHRARLAMQASHAQLLSGHVEADETFIGGAARFMHKDRRERSLLGRTGHSGKAAVLGMLERSAIGLSRVRTRVLKNVERNSIQAEIKTHVLTDGTTTLYTDALRAYDKNTRRWFPSRGEKPMVNNYIHQVIDHAERYVDGVVHTNGIENFWSLLKRTIKGTYVSVEPFHLFRYLDEQSSRFNMRGLNDGQRFASTLSTITGRRLTYAQLTGHVQTTAV